MKYYFLMGIIFVVIFAWNVPNIGNNDGPLATHITAGWVAVCVEYLSRYVQCVSNLAISTIQLPALSDSNQLIFLVFGLGVKTREFKKAALFWQLNLFVLFFIFVYHPLLGFGLTSLLRQFTSMTPYLLDGLMMTMCLPCTVTGAVVLTANCSGNEAAAVVNSSGANMLGIILSPALIFVFLGNLGDVDMVTFFSNLALRVVVPVKF